MAGQCEFATEVKRPEMRIEHIAIWVSDIEETRSFYEHYFNAKAGEKYVNLKKNFTSYFLSFEQGARLELMHRSEIPASVNQEDLPFPLVQKKKLTRLPMNLEKMDSKSLANLELQVMVIMKV